jgi:hypothetical protein
VLFLKEMPRPDQVNSQECNSLCKRDFGQRKRARLVAVAGVKGSVKPASRQAWVLISVGASATLSWRVFCAFVCSLACISQAQARSGIVIRRLRWAERGRRSPLEAAVRSAGDWSYIVVLAFEPRAKFD